MVCVCVCGGVKGGKHEGRIIKNVNWLHKNELCMCFSLLPTLHPPACRGSTYQHEEGGAYELRPHRERNQTFLNAERLARKLA